MLILKPKMNPKGEVWWCSLLINHKELKVWVARQIKKIIKYMKMKKHMSKYNQWVSFGSRPKQNINYYTCKSHFVKQVVNKLKNQLVSWVTR